MIYNITMFHIYGRSHDYTRVISKFSLKNWSEWYITSPCSIYGRSHDYTRVISKFSLKNWSEWYITSPCSIYGRSHDYTRVISKLGSKMRSEWYITSLCSIYKQSHHYAGDIQTQLKNPVRMVYNITNITTLTSPSRVLGHPSVRAES